MRRLLRSVILFALLILSASARTKSPSSKSVAVRQYSRKDGTVVSAHRRSMPGTARRAITTRSAGTHPKASSVRSSRTPAVRTTLPKPAGIQRNDRGRIERSTAAKHSFEASHPCPATGRKSGPCNGWVVDHVKPLACGGADAPSNMQWQTEAAAKIKDRTERAGCVAR
jgi:hypothetical protein